MFKLKIIARSILRQKLNNSIITISLAIGIACLSLISIFIKKELKTDSFHENSKGIYALNYDNPLEKSHQRYDCNINSVLYMTDNFSQIEDYCLQSKSWSSKILVGNDYYYNKTPILKVSGNFFDFFNFKLLSKNPATVLQTQNSVVISENLAMKYFGTLNAEGKMITFIESDKKEEKIVSAVFQKPKENSHLDFEMVVLMDKQIPNWKSSFCYFRLKDNLTSDQLTSVFNSNFKNLPTIPFYEGMSFSYHLIPIREMYFDPDYYGGRDKSDLYISMIIGLIILIIATFNYLGLINNKLLVKTPDFAIQRIHGGSKMSFIQSFLFEQILLIGISMLFSFLFIIWGSPFFNEITSSGIEISYIFQFQQLLIQTGIAGVLIIATFLFVLIRINKTTFSNSFLLKTKQVEKRHQLPIFSIFQLTSTLVLIICSVVITKQINYIINKPIGIDKEVIQIVPGMYSNVTSVFKEELLRNSLIENVSATRNTPLGGASQMNFKYHKNGKEIDYTANGFIADANYIKTLGIKLMAGSSFSGNPNSDYNKCVVNQTFAKQFPNQYLVGKELPGREEIQIIGIVKDFHYSNLKKVVEPAIIFADGQNFPAFLLIKVNKNNINQAREAIGELWTKLIPDYPIEITTMEEKYEYLHKENKNYLKLIGSCCLISIFLSMIGLFAISIQSSQRRTKEIGIRKVNGARISEILFLLNTNFIKWVVIAFVLATPIAYFAMNKWLENFAYKTNLSWWIFALAGVLALGIALLTVSFQSYKAATRNPVESLRYE